MYPIIAKTWQGPADVRFENGYKIYAFDVDVARVSGNILDPVCRNPADTNRVCDELLRWHFRQSVLTNMRGAGEPAWEHDFPPGSDVMGGILSGSHPGQRMELELAERFRVPVGQMH